MFALLYGFYMDHIYKTSGLRERSRFTWTPHVTCILYMKVRGGRNWKEVGRTELLENTLDPEWSKTFLLDYYFEEKQVSQKYFFREYN